VAEKLESFAWLGLGNGCRETKALSLLRLQRFREVNSGKDAGGDGPGGDERGRVDGLLGGVHAAELSSLLGGVGGGGERRGLLSGVGAAATSAAADTGELSGELEATNRSAMVADGLGRMLEMLSSCTERARPESMRNES